MKNIRKKNHSNLYNEKDFGQNQKLIEYNYIQNTHDNKSLKE